MADQTHVLAIAGSLRAGSHTRTACTHALDAAAQTGARTTLLDPREYDLPLIDPDDDLADAGDAAAMTARVREADSVILGTPMYHGSYSSVIKTVLDYCGFDEFDHTTVGLLAVAGGQFPVTALDHLRGVCRALDAWVIPHQAVIPRASRQFDADGAFRDPDLQDRVETLGRRAVEFASIEPDPATFESEENVGA